MKTKCPSRLKRARPNKLSQGMTMTAERSGHVLYKSNQDASRLSVYGTCDKFAGLRMSFYRKYAGQGKCLCCGQEVKKYRLNDSGRSYLSRLRKRLITMVG